MERRAFLGAVTGSLLAAPLAAKAQQAGKVYTLGILSPNLSPPPERRGRGPSNDKLKELGWTEGQNLVIERAFGKGREDRLPELAEMLVRRRVDVIFAVGAPSTLAAAQATKTIPIVFWGVSFPVELGLVDSIGRPGRNVTGVAFATGPELIAKELERREFAVASAPAAFCVRAWQITSWRRGQKGGTAPRGLKLAVPRAIHPAAAAFDPARAHLNPGGPLQEGAALYFTDQERVL